MTRAYWQLLVLTLVTIAAFISRTSLGPLQETMRVALTMSDNQMALLQGPPLAIGVLVGIPLGVVIDRSSRARLLLLFSVIGLLSLIIAASASNFLLLFAARCLTGIAASATWVTVLAMVADWFPPAQRGRATMVVSFGATLGMSAAFTAAGALVMAAGPSDDAWRWAMLGLAAPLALGVLLAIFIKDPERAADHSRSDLRTAWSALWHYRARLLPLALGMALVGGIADGAAVVWAAPALSRSHALTADRVGAIMGIVLLINGALGPLLGGTLADLTQRRGGPLQTVNALGVLLVITVPAGLFALAPSALISSIGLTLFLIGGTAFQVGLFALVTIIVPNGLRASCLSFILAIGLLFAFGVAPSLVSSLAGRMGGSHAIGQSLAAVCVASGALGALIFWLGRSAFQPQNVTETKIHEHGQRQTE